MSLLCPSSKQRPKIWRMRGRTEKKKARCEHHTRDRQYISYCRPTKVIMAQLLRRMSMERDGSEKCQTAAVTSLCFVTMEQNSWVFSGARFLSSMSTAKLKVWCSFIRRSKSQSVSVVTQSFSPQAITWPLVRVACQPVCSRIELTWIQHW